MSVNFSNVRNVSVEEFNTIIQDLAKWKNFKYEEYKQYPMSLLSSFTSYVWSGLVHCNLVYKDFNDKMQYVRCRLDNEIDYGTYTPMYCWSVVNKNYKIPFDNYVNFINKDDRDENYDVAIHPYVYKNDKYQGKRLKVWIYDLNSAYASQMIDKIPDTEHMRFNDIVGENEIGFKESSTESTLELVDVGEWGDVVCPLIDMPNKIKSFIKKYYKLKKNATDKNDKANAKNMLNFIVGMLKYRNVFWRAYIMGKSKQLIENTKNKDTIYCNTDCIVSLTERPDLKIGTELGEWKLEYNGDFAFKGYSYQCYDINKVSYKGVPNSWFNEGYDILKDGIPFNNNKLYFNTETNQVEAYNEKKN